MIIWFIFLFYLHVQDNYINILDKQNDPNSVIVLNQQSKMILIASRDFIQKKIQIKEFN